MPPSCSLNSGHGHENIVLEIDNNAIETEQSFQEICAHPVLPCQDTRSPHTSQKAQTTTDNCLIKIDVLKSLVIKQPSRCDPIHCTILINLSRDLALINECHCHKKVSCTLNRSTENKINLQQQVAQHNNNFHEDDEQNDSGIGSCGFQSNCDSRFDLQQLQKNEQELLECGFYFGSIDSQISNSLLKMKPIGTFLIRDSSDHRYLYSLSVKTEKGATSIRILYINGFFQFDSDKRIRHKLPQFDSLLSLVNYHVEATEKGRNKLWRWEEVTGSKSLSVILTKPLKNSVPTLAHLSRVKINQCLDNIDCPQLAIDRLPLDSDLKEFVRQYTYRV